MMTLTRNRRLALLGQVAMATGLRRERVERLPLYVEHC